MITIVFDTYSSLGTSTVDGSYGGGAPGSGRINDEICIHKDQNSNDLGLLPSSTVDAGNLEDGLEHEVCISYDATTHVVKVTLDGATKLTYNLATTGGGSDLSSYFGAGATLNYTWSAGKYGANNMQTIAPTGVSIFGKIGHNLCDNTILPVKMISFSGQLINGTAVLNWATAQETDNKEFVIERSADGVNWQAIDVVEGHGNSNAVLSYSYTDYAPLAGIAYYRLKQVDINGAFERTKIIAIEKITTYHVNLMPNPFDDVITIVSDAEGKVNVQIYDMLGKLVYYTSSTSNVLTISPQLPAGAYVITLQTDTFVEQQKIIKK
jgi:hypothetical protein